MTLEQYVYQYLIEGWRGGFAAALAVAWCRADSGNRAILQSSFNYIFTIPKELQ